MSTPREEPVLAYIGVGSNLDNPRRQVETIFPLLDELPGCHLQERSSLYRSAPFGGVEQDDFVNAVAVIETAVPAPILLACFKELERIRGRDPAEVRWGPRVIDLDILLYGDYVIDTETLSVPHPGISERNFVLLPLQELAPDLVIPGLGRVGDISVDEKSPAISKIS